MYNLLIDIGNSNVKIARGNPGDFNIKLLKQFPYSKEDFMIDFKTKFKILKSIHSFSGAGISILEKENERFLSEYLGNIYGLQPVFINTTMNLPLKRRYSKGLGNDRICNAVAGSVIYGKKNTLIVDFGTATTYTMVSNGALIGGMISPGIRTSLKALNENTALPEVNLTFPRKLINDNTLDNIRAGILYQSLFSLERTIQEVGKTFKDLFVIATGGYSSLLAERTSLVDTIDKNLVLKGINILISR